MKMHMGKVSWSGWYYQGLFNKLAIRSSNVWLAATFWHNQFGCSTLVTCISQNSSSYMYISCLRSNLKLLAAWAFAT